MRKEGLMTLGKGNPLNCAAGMEEATKDAGMKDSWLRIIAVAGIAAFMQFFLSQEWDFSKGAFFSGLFITIIYTVTIYEGNRYIMIELRRKLSWEANATRRLLAQVFLSVGYTLLVIIVLTIILEIVYPQSGLKGEALVAATISAVLITLMMNAIYEGIYFARRWRMSFMRAEVLKRANLHTQFENLKSQVNPHFLFSSLNTLASIIEEDKQLAGSYVQELSAVYRYILQSRDWKLVEVSKELQHAREYLFLLKARFGDQLKVNFRVDEEGMQKLIPPVTLQLLLENVVKHNAISLEKPLFVDIYNEKGQLVISNNLQKKEVLPSHAPSGLKNIRERYEYLLDRPVVVVQTERTFTVKLPLINVEVK